MRSRKAIIEDLTSRYGRIPNELDRIEIYHARNDLKNEYGAPPDDPYEIIGQQKFFDAIARALAGEEWTPALADSIRYRLFSYRLNYYWHYRLRRLSPPNPRPMRMMSWERMSETLACCVMLNQMKEAIYLAYLTFSAINLRYQLALSYNEEHRRAQAFILRLFADWQGGMRHDWPSDLKSEPTYEGILARWRDPESNQLAKLLKDACDRHVRQALNDTSNRFFDFPDESMMRTPVEILMVFRLRELIGLTNPTVKHPLLKSPFDKLPAHEPLPPPEPIMQATLSRLWSDWPDFDKATWLESIMKTAA